MWPRRAALAALLLAGGCGGLPKREPFPIGLFNVSDPSALARVREAGFDHVFPTGTPAQEQSVALEAGRRGMRVVASPSVALGPDRVKRWPVAAWYLLDEPDVNNVSPGRMSDISKAVRGWDPRPQTFTVGRGSEARAYGAIGDVLMLDWYPVPHLPLESVADQIDAALRELPAGKPLWFVVQAFDWREDALKTGRFPSYAEIRFTSWLAILHGAKGLFFFRFPRPGGKTLLDFPEDWRSLELASRELRSFQPVLESGSPAALPFSPRPRGLEAKCWAFRGRRFVVVLNRESADYYRLPAELLGPSWKVVSGDKGLLKAAHGGWYVRSYQVLVFEGPA